MVIVKLSAHRFEKITRHTSPNSKTMKGYNYDALKLGKTTSDGVFVYDARKVPMYHVPDMTGFQLKPYVSLNTPLIARPTRPLSTSGIQPNRKHPDAEKYRRKTG
eukprot:GHVN01035893.1.p1 GENE.GHVN01035893.1~~GHVN01035893.1.p1  ORF type:complete len:105 (+),score=1.93 GHVN01035893.1:222-536(+)